MAEMEKNGEHNFWDRYKLFIKQNQGTARMIETALQYSGFILPSRSDKKEVMIELGYAASSLAGLLHDRIVNNVIEFPESSIKIRAMRHIQLILLMISHIEITAEKVSYSVGGHNSTQTLISTIEVLKMIMRLSILFIKRDMLIAGAYSASDILRKQEKSLFTRVGTSMKDLGLLRDSQKNSMDILNIDNEYNCNFQPQSYPKLYQGKRCGRKYAIPTRCDKDFQTNLYNSAGSSVILPSTCCGLRHSQEQINPKKFISEQRYELQSHNGLLLAGEVLHIVRPAVYSLVADKFSNSWLPWLLSLSIDLASHWSSRCALSNSTHLNGLGNHGRIQMHDQNTELKRRKIQWFLYLLRSPIFELIMDPTLKSIVEVFNGIPLLGRIVSYSVQMLLYVQRHHFYTSGY